MVVNETITCISSKIEWSIRNLSEDGWKRALETWKESWKSKRTIAILGNYQPL